MSMNPVIKAKWVSDLRSGKYEQGKGALNRNGKLYGEYTFGQIADLIEAQL
jgi:hypothetical protein